MIRPCHGYQAILGVVGGQRGACEATNLARTLLARSWIYAGRNPKWAWGAALAAANGSPLTMAQRVGLRADRAAAEATLDDRARAEAMERTRVVERIETRDSFPVTGRADARFENPAVVGAWIDEIA